jgi:hypothetical protein
MKCDLADCMKILPFWLAYETFNLIIEAWLPTTDKVKANSRLGILKNVIVFIFKAIFTRRK